MYGQSSQTTITEKKSMAIITATAATDDDDIDYRRRRQISADSFERFGDDLVELLLSYLPIDQKVCYESVGRQWQRLIYTTVQTLTIEQSMSVKSVALLLRKCPNVTHVVFRRRDDGYQKHRLLDTVVDGCHQLRHLTLGSISWPLSIQTVDRFFDRFRYQLRSFSVEFNYHYMSATEPILADHFVRCPLLLGLDIKSRGFRQNIGYDLITNDGNNCPTTEPMFRYLNSLTFCFTVNTVNSYKRFIANYCRSMQSVSVTLVGDQCTDESVNQLLTGLSQMPGLSKLKISTRNYGQQFGGDSGSSNHHSAYIGHHWHLIGDKCPKLKSVSLEMAFGSAEHMSQELKSLAINTGRRLRRLYLNLRYSRYDCHVTTKLLRNFPRLTHLSVRGKSLRDQFFGDDDDDDIGHNLPQLQSLVGIVSAGFPMNRLRSLSRLPRLQYVRVVNFGDYIAVQFTDKLKSEMPKCHTFNIINF